jgi:gamma-glutamyltranspeptidase/glutathione hydrolase
MRLRHTFLIAAALAIGSGAAPSISAPASVPGMVSAADRRAADAGVEMLRQGGTAADAAFATLRALNVVVRQCSGSGGGGYRV